MRWPPVYIHKSYFKRKSIAYVSGHGSNMIRLKGR